MTCHKYIPCHHIGDKTLAKHNPRWAMPCPDFPFKLKINKMLGISQCLYERQLHICMNDYTPDD